LDEWHYIAMYAVDLARETCPDAPWLLYMEDDVILEPSFESLPELLDEADGLFPNAGIVSFFSPFGTGWIAGIPENPKPGWSTYEMARFAWLQCAAVRNTDRLLGFRDFIEARAAERAQGLYTTAMTCEESDGALGSFLATHYDVYALWYPHLVRDADVGHISPIRIPPR